MSRKGTRDDSVASQVPTKTNEQLGDSVFHVIGFVPVLLVCQVQSNTENVRGVEDDRLE